MQKWHNASRNRLGAQDKKCLEDSRLQADQLLARGPLKQRKEQRAQALHILLSMKG